MIRAALLILASLSLGGCGYHVSGQGNLMPATVKTIAIPAFTNLTTRYRLSERLPAALAHEFIQRTRYRVVADINEADAVLYGAVNNYMSFPITAEQRTGRASSVQMSVFVSLQLRERESGKLIYDRPNFEIRQRYEISQDPVTYFEESDAGLERLSRDVAKSVVSAVLEAF
jgi:outer membrane lipopolysaccharide assembly protein LptE/RlpB